MKDKFKLPAYTAMASAFLSINSPAGAKAVYVDIDPDIIIHPGESGVNLDFNTDGTWDISFGNELWTFTTGSDNSFIWHQVHAAADYGIGPWTTYSTYFGPIGIIKFLSIGDTIDEELYTGGPWPNGWGPAGELMFSYDEITPPFFYNSGGYWFPEHIDGYIGVWLKFFTDGEYKNHYGWIRCSVLDGGNELVIKDYAYELLPDVPIIAGDTVGRIVEFAHDTIPQFGTGLPDADNEVSNAIIYSFGSTVYIRAHGLNGDASVNIYNITGETVYIGSMNSDFLNVEMTQPSGIYLVELIADKQRTCRKVILD